MPITWDNVLAWRMRRQMLVGFETSDPVEITRRLCGVQAQVASSAAMAIALRQGDPNPRDVDAGLSAKRLVKTWAMRGTLHLLPVEDAGVYLSLLASGRHWEKGSWQRTFATADQIAALGVAVGDALDGRVLTREQLVAEVVRRTKDTSLVEKLGSGWGALLKPLAFQGLICHGPSDGSNVTFARPDSYFPDWRPLPEPGEAADVAIPAYLGAYGPAPIAAFDQWFFRGALTKPALRAWGGRPRRPARGGPDRGPESLGARGGPRRHRVLDAINPRPAASRLRPVHPRSRHQAPDHHPRRATRRDQQGRGLDIPGHRRRRTRRRHMENRRDDDHRDALERGAPRSPRGHRGRGGADRRGSRPRPRGDGPDVLKPAVPPTPT